VAATSVSAKWLWTVASLAIAGFLIAAPAQSPNELLQKLLEADFATRESAIDSLSGLTVEARESLATRLVDVWKHSDRDRRGRAGYALERMDLASARALELALDDSDADLKLTAIGILARIGKRNPTTPAINGLALALARALGDSDDRVRFAAAVALTDIGTPAKAAAPALHQALRDKDERVRLHAANALAGMRDSGADTVEILVASLGNSDPFTRQSAALSLGWLGPQAKSAVASLLHALADTDNIVRLYAADSLARIDPSNGEGVKVLAGLLTDRNVGVRSAAAEALERLGPVASDAAAALDKALKDEDQNVRDAAVVALGAIGPAAKNQVADLAELLPHSDMFLAAQILETLSKINTPEALRLKEEYQRRPNKQ
jgi:HEAT repeat protein